MAESKPSPTHTSSDKEVKAPNLIERAKEEVGAMLHHKDESNHHHEETHGLRKDIDEKTPLEEVKAPNVFERAKEEFEAIVEAIHFKKESDSSVEIKKESKQDKAESKSENNGNSPRFLDYAKGKIKTIMHHDKSPKLHNKETHGTSDEIDNTTPVDHVKAPNVFERAKEEIEAIVQTIHPKKEEKNSVSPPK
ncbi:hypothetical protein RchiOBHm_Chr2g0093691 [Rosa chinensis]|uniref:Uncharacterized protein n=1 Tax=Rosa chinensis TaxID=74649 RepID=A0A2P6RKB8_ROSCH|nr:uncharacterized protein LOC112189318 [Rosa chinensis]PRQ46874.1 hypothetical protein RchiOBHm_Chr2g0093691 [Rosa chinensis]